MNENVNEELVCSFCGEGTVGQVVVRPGYDCAEDVFNLCGKHAEDLVNKVYMRVEEFENGVAPAGAPFSLEM